MCCLLAKSHLFGILKQQKANPYNKSQRNIAGVCGKLAIMFNIKKVREHIMQANERMVYEGNRVMAQG